jgi:hypothetical protein
MWKKWINNFSKTSNGNGYINEMNHSFHTDSSFRVCNCVLLEIAFSKGDSILCKWIQQDLWNLIHEGPKFNLGFKEDTEGINAILYSVNYHCHMQILAFINEGPRVYEIWTLDLDFIQTTKGNNLKTILKNHQ